MYIYRIEFTLEQKFQKILKTNPKMGEKNIGYQLPRGVRCWC